MNSTFEIQSRSNTAYVHSMVEARDINVVPADDAEELNTPQVQGNKVS